MIIEPGIVVGVDLANIIYSTPEAGEIETPTMEQDEIMKEDTGSDCSIEPYMAADVSYPDLIPDEIGESVDLFEWPLDEQPLTLLMKQVRDPVLQPGSLGGTSLGVGSLVSLASTLLRSMSCWSLLHPRMTQRLLLKSMRSSLSFS